MSGPNVLEIKTVQIAPFRTLMTALKDILLETNISFQPDGIRIVNMDKSHTILAYLFLDAKKFEHYYCEFPNIVIGVNMFHLFKLINSIDNDDTLTIYIERSEYSDGIVDYLGLKFVNGEIKQCKNQKLKLIEPDEEELDVPEVPFSSIINLSINSPLLQFLTSFIFSFIISFLFLKSSLLKVCKILFRLLIFILLRIFTAVFAFDPTLFKYFPIIVSPCHLYE